MIKKIKINKIAFLRLCTILLLCFATISCEKEEPVVVTPFSFLTIGNEWSYNLTTIQSSGGNTEILEDTTETRYVDTMLFEESTNSRNYVLFSNLSYGDVVGIFYIHDMNDNSLSLFDIKLFYWDCYLGQKWFVKRDGGKDYYAEVVSMSEVIETPAGFFDCINLKISRDEDKETGEDYLHFWISKKYGIIKMEGYNGTPTEHKKSISVLKSKNF